MPFQDVSDYEKLMSAYLQNRYPLGPVPEGYHPLFYIRNVAKLKLLCSIILDNWSKNSLKDKLKIIRIIDDVIMSSKNLNDKTETRIKKLKAELTTNGFSNWKDALLGIKAKTTHNIHFTPQLFDISAEHQIQFDSSRFSQYSGALFAQDSHAITGSTFVTNRERIIAISHSENGALKQTYGLDALYASYTYDNSDDPNGIIIALGDGCGGHYGDAEQDKVIARASHFATKHAARLLALAKTPDELKGQLSWIIEEIAIEVRRKTYHKDEGTTLVAGRTFLTDKGYRFVGFNIGDSMMVSFDPQNQTCLTIAPARVTLSGRDKQEGTAIFPTAYNNSDIQFIDTQVPMNTIFLALSDGAYDYLPCKSIEKIFPQTQAAYRETYLDELAMRELLNRLPNDVAIEKVLISLVQFIVKSMDNLRQEKMAIVNKAKNEFTKLAQQEKTLSAFAEEIRAEEEKINLLAHDKDSQCLKDEIERKKVVHVLQCKEFKQEADKLQSQTTIQLGDEVTISGVRLPLKFGIMSHKGKEKRREDDCSSAPRLGN